MGPPGRSESGAPGPGGGARARPRGRGRCPSRTAGARALGGGALVRLPPLLCARLSRDVVGALAQGRPRARRLPLRGARVRSARRQSGAQVPRMRARRAVAHGDLADPRSATGRALQTRGMRPLRSDVARLGRDGDPRLAAGLPALPEAEPRALRAAGPSYTKYTHPGGRGPRRGRRARRDWRLGARLARPRGEKPRLREPLSSISSTNNSTSPRAVRGCA